MSKSLAKAVEFAGYMATSAEHLLDAINRADQAWLAKEAGEPIDEDDVDNTEISKGEAMAALRSAIYEFRERVP